MASRLPAAVFVQRLVGVAPLALRSPWTRLGDRARELVFWGAAGQTRSPLMRGFVDVLAQAEYQDAVWASFASWLDSDASDWNLFSLLRLPSGSPTADRLRDLARRRGWRTVHPGQADISIANILDLPADLDAWDARSDRKARYNMRREVRLFEGRANGRFVFRTIELGAKGKGLTLAEASAMKLYSAQAATEVALEAVQLFGGNGYMAEYQVEQLARDAKVLQIYAGTDEIQVTHIARDLLSR